jgi:uncharacterized protein YbjT (DUF2867 family)
VQKSRRIDDGITLVLGSSGKTGRRVAERLRALGREVRLVSRSTQPGFDWTDRTTWGPVLRGARAAYVSYQPHLGSSAAIEAAQAFFALAVESGVKKVVLLSAHGDIEAQRAEDALRTVDVDWTILRASWLCQNFSEGFFLNPLSLGLLVLPVGSISTTEPFVDADDIADVAVAALNKHQHERQTYQLTGPRSLSFAGAAAEIARATGRKVRCVAVRPDAYRTALKEANVSEQEIDLALYLFSSFDGGHTPVMDGVQRALGRAPRDFVGYATRAAAAGVWGFRGLQQPFRQLPKPEPRLNGGTDV